MSQQLHSQFNYNTLPVTPFNHAERQNMCILPKGDQSGKFCRVKNTFGANGNIE